MKVFAALIGLSAFASLAGCSSPSTGSSATDDSADAAPSVATPPASTTSPASPGNTSGVDAAADAGPWSPVDPASPDASVASDAGAPAPGGAFAGAPAYVATLGPSTIVRRHTPSGDDPAGQPCLSCHTGAKGVTKFLFGGTVYADAAGTKRAASVEVRVRDAAGKAQSAYSDANGNYFFAQGTLPALAPPASAGVRDATHTSLMTNAINDGDCNSCHHAGGEGPIHLP